MARTKTQNQQQAQLQASNRALHSALRSAYKRGLLGEEPSFQTARQISIASAHYFKFYSGQMTESECKQAIETCFSYQAESHVF